MKRDKPLTVRIGSHGYAMKEVTRKELFTHQELNGEWHVVSNHLDRYVLCTDAGKYLRFIEFTQNEEDNFVVYKRREWHRRPRDDNAYTLVKHERYHGTRMPIEFGQALKKTLSNEQEPEASIISE